MWGFNYLTAIAEAPKFVHVFSTFRDLHVKAVTTTDPQLDGGKLLQIHVRNTAQPFGWMLKTPGGALYGPLRSSLDEARRNVSYGDTIAEIYVKEVR